MICFPNTEIRTYTSGYNLTSWWVFQRKRITVHGIQGIQQDYTTISLGVSFTSLAPKMLLMIE